MSKEIKKATITKAMMDKYMALQQDSIIMLSIKYPGKSNKRIELDAKNNIFVVGRKSFRSAKPNECRLLMNVIYETHRTLEKSFKKANKAVVETPPTNNGEPKIQP